MIFLNIDKSYLPGESLALYKGWLKALKSDFYPQASPWVPIGNVGPVLMLGHFDTAAAQNLFPLAQCFAIDKKAYAEVLEHLEINFQDISLDGLILPQDPSRADWSEETFEPSSVVIPSTYVCENQSVEVVVLEAVKHFLKGQLLCDPRALILPQDSILPAPVKKRFDALVAASNEKELAVCTSNAFTLELKDQILQRTSKKPVFLLTLPAIVEEKAAILEKLSRLKHIRSAGAATTTGPGEGDPKNARLRIDPAVCIDINPDSDEHSFERILEWIVYQAYIQEASDIHFEQFNGCGRVRFRIHGELKAVYSPSLENMRALVNVAMNTCKMQHGDSMNQDSSFAADINGDLVSIRANAMPFRDSFPKLTYRILPKSSQKVYLKELVNSPEHLQAFQRAIIRPQGLILITGPTGEGKTTTLYACLDAINTPDINIQTIEDPIEKELEGINQTQVNTKKDVTFAKLMRSVVRQDPDVILLGEIRDKESAELAIEAALTGHLVFSTLHANSALKSISRLLQLGVPPYLFADSLLLVQAQRLARRLCPHCRKKRTMEISEAALLDRHRIEKPDACFYEPVGCPRCSMSGFAGRTALMEIIQFDEQLCELVAQSAPLSAIKAQVQSKDFGTFFQDALLKAASGTITLQEALRFEPAFESHTHHAS